MPFTFTEDTRRTTFLCLDERGTDMWTAILEGIGIALAVAVIAVVGGLKWEFIGSLFGRRDSSVDDLPDADPPTDDPEP